MHTSYNKSTAALSYLKDDPAFTLHELLESVKGAYWHWNLENKTIHWSPQASTLLGCEEIIEEQLQSEFVSLIYLKTLPQLLEAIENAPTAREIQKVEIGIQDGDGKLNWFEMVILPGHLQASPSRTVFGAMLDINKPKKLKQELSSSNYLLGEACRIANLGAWEVDIFDDEISWSPQVYKIHEVPEDFVPSLDNAFDFYQGASYTILKDRFQQLTEEYEPFDLELEFRTYSGRLKWVRVKCEPCFSENELIKVQGFIQDITKDKEYGDLLKEHETLFYSAFHHAPDGRALINHHQIKINERLRDLLGYSESFYQHHDFEDITFSEDREKEKKAQAPYVEGKTDQYVIEKRMIRHDGVLVWTRFSRNRVRNVANEILHEIVQVQDIGKQKSRELKKTHKIEALSKQNNQLSNFAHIVSHNLRSHSGNLEMLCYLYDKEEKQEEREQLVDNIKKISQGLNTTIGHLSEIVMATQDINRNVKKLSFQEVLGQTEQILERQITNTHARVESDFTACPLVEYPPAYLDSIFLNMVSNAIKYRRPGQPPIVKVKSCKKQGRACLTFEDNGRGMDLQQHGEKLFGLYKTFHGNEDAHGVGLFLTKSQVEAMGGEINVESEVGKGTTFTITF